MDDFIKGLQQLQHHLVRTIGRPHLIDPNGHAFADVCADTRTVSDYSAHSHARTFANCDSDGCSADTNEYEDACAQSDAYTDFGVDGNCEHDSIIGNLGHFGAYADSMVRCWEVSSLSFGARSLQPVRGFGQGASDGVATVCTPIL